MKIVGISSGKPNQDPLRVNLSSASTRSTRNNSFAVTHDVENDIATWLRAGRSVDLIVTPGEGIFPHAYPESHGLNASTIEILAFKARRNLSVSHIDSDYRRVISIVPNRHLNTNRYKTLPDFIPAEGDTKPCSSDNNSHDFYFRLNADTLNEPRVLKKMAASMCAHKTIVIDCGEFTGTESALSDLRSGKFNPALCGLLPAAHLALELFPKGLSAGSKHDAFLRESYQESPDTTGTVKLTHELKVVSLDLESGYDGESLGTTDQLIAIIRPVIPTASDGFTAVAEPTNGSITEGSLHETAEPFTLEGSIDNLNIYDEQCQNIYERIKNGETLELISASCDSSGVFVSFDEKKREPQIFYKNTNADSIRRLVLPFVIYSIDNGDSPSLRKLNKHGVPSTHSVDVSDVSLDDSFSITTNDADDPDCRPIVMEITAHLVNQDRPVKLSFTKQPDSPGMLEHALVEINSDASLRQSGDDLTRFVATSTR